MTNLLTVVGAAAGIAILLIMALTPLLTDEPAGSGRTRHEEVSACRRRAAARGLARPEPA